MNSITITLSDEKLTEIKQKAAFLGLSAAELVQISVCELIERPDDDFMRTAQYILNKNKELYKHLS